jgi:aryl-alcohol dehydrogenase-like predicted oxidoreductase
MRGESSAEIVATIFRKLVQTEVSPMIGAKSVHQLIDSMGAVELRLSEADLAEISNAAAWERSRTDREDKTFGGYRAC